MSRTEEEKEGRGGEKEGNGKTESSQDQSTDAVLARI